MAEKLTYEELEQIVEKLEKENAELKLADAKFYYKRGFVKSIIQNSPVFLVVVSPDGKTLMMNETMRAFLDYSEEELAGKDYLASFVHKDDRQVVAEIIKSLTTSTKPSMNANRVVAKDGRELLLEWHGRQVFKSNGELDYFWKLGIGITKRIQTEEEKKQLLEDLHRTRDDMKTLSGLLPLCSHCKKIRDDKGYWNQVDSYIQEHSEADVSHSICPECAKKHYPDLDIYDD
jgi:PAS domain S-box-containing protein